MNDNDTALLMCAPITMPAHVASVRHLGDCGHEVWVSNTMAPYIGREGFTFKCILCCMKDPEFIRATMAGEAVITPAQRTELNKKLGVGVTDQIVAQLGVTEVEI